MAKLTTSHGVAEPQSKKSAADFRRWPQIKTPQWPKAANLLRSVDSAKITRHRFVVRQCKIQIKNRGDGTVKEEKFSMNRAVSVLIALLFCCTAVAQQHPSHSG